MEVLGVIVGAAVVFILGCMFWVAVGLGLIKFALWVARRLSI